MKGRVAAHSLASIRNESWLKVGVVSVSALLLWLGLLRAFYFGFTYLQDFSPALSGEALSIGDILMARLLGVFALALFFLLIFSNTLIVFSTLYKAKEVRFLMTSPVTIRTLFLTRFIECVSFSSWASAFLGSPLLLAYGWVTGAHPVYYLAAIAFYVPFVTIPAAIGATLTMVFVRVFPRLPRGVFFGVAAVAVGGLFVYLRRSFQMERMANPGDATLNFVLETTAQVQSPLLPSYWASQGVLAAAEGALGQSLYLFLLLLANACFITLIATECAQVLFIPGFNSIVGSENNRPRPVGKGILGRLDLLLRFVPNPIRPLVIKDIKLFWRDPTQWTQFVIFFGIMAVYVANLGNREMAQQSELYRSFIAGLNSAACTLILASLTSRFVYPLISLEGFRFWVLGLAPLTLRQLMWQKYWLAIATTAPITVTLVTASCLFLEVGVVRLTVAMYSIILANLTLAGLAVGIGSLYPNFEEDNPARIVSGMGGTLNFLLSVGYIALLIGGQIMVFQARALGFADGDRFRILLAGVLVFGTVLSIVGIVVPMRLGLRNLERTEF